MLLFPPPVEIGDDEGFTPENDIFNRRGFGENLGRLIENADDALVLGIDDPWGEGKTTFIKQWRGLLRSETFGLDSIYFDAFANDYQDEPFEAIAEELYAFIDQKADADDSEYWQEHKEGFLDGAKKMFASTSASVGKIMGAGTGAAAVAVTGACGPEVDGAASGLGAAGEAMGQGAEAYFKARLKRKSGREGFQDALKIIGKGLREEGKSLVFVIDELDRCRPDYALDLLESVKHVFSVPGIAFVLVYNGNQMQEHIRCRYGREVKAGLYLNKFIDITTRMPKTVNARQPHNDDNYKFIQRLVERMELHFEAGKVLAVYATRKGLALRELEKLMTMIALSKASLPKKYIDWDVVIVGVCLIRSLDDQLFSNIAASVECWGDLNAFMEFERLTEDELDYADMAWFRQTWTCLIDPAIAPEEKNRFQSLGGGVYRSPIPQCCRSLTSFCSAHNGEGLLFRLKEGR